MRNIVAGLRRVPADVLEAADGDGLHRARAGCARVELPLALPLDRSPGCGSRRVSTIGLVTITGILGDRFGGLGFFIFEGYRHSFPTEILFGAVPSIVLAIAVDLRSSRLQRRLTPWTPAATAPTTPTTRRRRARPMNLVEQTIAWLTDPAHWQGPTASRPGSLEHLALSGVVAR